MLERFFYYGPPPTHWCSLPGFSNAIEIDFPTKEEKDKFEEWWDEHMTITKKELEKGFKYCMNTELLFASYVSDKEPEDNILLLKLMWG